VVTAPLIITHSFLKMGKKRHTAKTGDQGIYKAARSVSKQQQPKRRTAVENENDAMYTVVDKFHMERDILKLDPQQQLDDDDDDNASEKEAVMDLGIGGDSSSSSESEEEDVDNSDDEEDGSSVPKNGASSSSSDPEEDNLSDESDSNEEFEVENVRDWGKKKVFYYNGDTADLELGQDEEDAYLEEQAANEVQAARYKEMSEDDFVLSDNEDEYDMGDPSGATTRDVSKLSAKDRQKLLEKQHPELLPLLSYFSSVVKDLDESTSVATKAVFEGELGTAEVCTRWCIGFRFE
jgi:U3 small nucleolar RNA-associated protein 3